MDKSIEKSTQLNKISMLLLATYPILNAYILFGNVTIVQFSGVLLFLYCTTVKGFSFNVYPKMFLLFWLYAALQLIVLAGNFKITYLFPGGISLCFYVLSLGVFILNYNEEILCKYLKYTFVVASALFIFQYATFLATGKHISVFLPITNNIMYSIQTYDGVVALHQSYSDRFPSIFLEPSYFGQYTILALCAELFCSKNKLKLITPMSFYMVIIELLIKSGVGLIGLIVVIFIKLFYVIFFSKKMKYIIYLILLIPIAIYGVNYYLNSDMGSGVSDRAMALDSRIGGQFQDQSSNERILYGFIEFSLLSGLDQAIGTSQETKTIIAERNSALNGFSNSLISYGILGTVLLFFSYFSKGRKSVFVISFGVLLFIVSFVETVLFDDFMLVCSSIVFANRGKSINET